MHVEQIAALRDRVDSAHGFFVAALDQAGRGGAELDPDRVEDLRQATERLMRALAAVMLYLGAA